MTVPSKPQIQRIPLSAGADKIVKAFQDDAVVIIEGFLSPEQLRALNSDIDPYIARLRDPEYVPDPSVDYSLAKLLPSQQKRVHSLAGKSQTFRQEFLNHQLMHEVASKVFEPVGDYWAISGAIIDNDPGTPEQPWHHDLPACPLFNEAADAPENMINFFTALTDFTEESGATQFIWHSHKTKGTERILEPDEDHPMVTAEIKAGDSVLLNGRIVHRGGSNDTDDFVRRAFSFVLQPSVFTPYESNLHLSRQIVESMTPLAQKMIGWRSVTLAGAYSIGMWTVDMDDVGNVMGLKSNQPLKTK
ncbi:unnamed protein product [Penicillium salamii]|uniref:Uncharacterized protein n=1 Tax=Penicillium salamii TaxID=1612424 RepID=A0A9W4K1W2_9EURO|nr:unnamed protein product [Penicillium salamii]CAG8011843.1 unnamed protein product [Penicillium salamii]CAG8158914.1 unnamed protein product [Penicillium salamii]CAG8191110.1 unnamed protein product [Penicillium salamii]CAG8309441.1 unnamed protein product [Penicillium salamii]